MIYKFSEAIRNLTFNTLLGLASIKLVNFGSNTYLRFLKFFRKSTKIQSINQSIPMKFEK